MFFPTWKSEHQGSELKMSLSFPGVQRSCSQICVLEKVLCCHIRKSFSFRHLIFEWSSLETFLSCMVTLERTSVWQDYAPLTLALYANCWHVHFDWHRHCLDTNTRFVHFWVFLMEHCSCKKVVIWLVGTGYIKCISQRQQGAYIYS